MLYKSNIITSLNGLEQTDTQVILLQNLTQKSSILTLEMFKYQTTDDIFGFSMAGRRKDSDYDTTFALYDTIKVDYKESRDPALANVGYFSSSSDQNQGRTDGAEDPIKSRRIWFNFDSK
jgi:hypothetical protein